MTPSPMTSARPSGKQGLHIPKMRKSALVRVAYNAVRLTDRPFCLGAKAFPTVLRPMVRPAMA
jgi:hypothetical protein